MIPLRTVLLALSMAWIGSTRDAWAQTQSYTVVLPPGISPVANQLVRGNNTLAEVLPEVPPGTVLYRWDPAITGLVATANFGLPGGWNRPGLRLNPGEGAFLLNPTRSLLSITFSGSVTNPPREFAWSAGYYLVSARTPQTSRFEEVFGFGPTKGTKVYRYTRPVLMLSNLLSKASSVHTFAGGQWDVVPLFEPGEAAVVRLVGVPPVILQHPTGTLLALGSSVELQVGATGAPPLGFQWRLNGANLRDATNATLVRTNVQLTDMGTYRVTVHNPFGAVNSGPAVVRQAVFPAFPLADYFEERVLIQSSFGVGVAVNSSASVEPGDPFNAGKPGGRSMWLTWVAPGTGIAQISTVGSSFDTLLAAYTGDSLWRLMEVASDDDDGEFFTSTIRFNAQQGTPYAIAIDGFNGASGHIAFRWQFEETVEMLPVLRRHPRDLAVSLGDPALFSVSALTTNVAFQWFFNGEAVPDATATNLVIARVRPEHLGIYHVRATRGTRSVESRKVSLQVAVHDGLFRIDDRVSTEKFGDAFANLTPKRLLKATEPGERVLLASPARGFTGTQIFSTVGALKEENEPNHCGVVGGASYWFAYQAETNGTLQLDTDGSSFDTVMAVYIGPGTDFLSLTNVACDNDSGADGRDSKVSFPVTAGTIYFIAVDGVNDPVTGIPATGLVVLNYQLLLPLELGALQFRPIAGGEFRFGVRGTVNVPVTIESSVDGNTWQPWLTNLNAGGAFMISVTNMMPQTGRWFRAVNGD